MGILTGKITLGSKEYNKIYSDTGNELCSKQGAIYRAFYSKNEFNKDDFTEISSGGGTISVENGLYYFQPMFTSRYEEQVSATDNSNISTGIQFTLSSLGITDDLAISAITIQIREDNTYSGIYKLAIFDQDNNLVTSSTSALVDSNFSNIPFKFVFDELQVLRANKKYYLYTTNSDGVFNTFGFRVTNISVNADYNFVQNNRYKPLLSIDFVDSKNYILEQEPTQTKEHFEISDWGQDVNAPANWSGYPIKFYPKAFGLKYNRVKINSISLKSGKNNFTGMNLDLSVNLFNDGTNKEFIDKSNENVEITAKDQILTFTFNNLYVNSNKLYIIEFGNKNPILQATSANRKNPNIRIFYKTPESECQQPIISVDYEYDIRDIFINNSFNKEVSSVVEKYLTGLEIPDASLDEKIINVSQDDFKTLVDNNNVQEKTAYLISSNNFSLYGDRITQLGDPVNDTDAVNLRYLKEQINILKQYIDSHLT